MTIMIISSILVLMHFSTQVYIVFGLLWILWFYTIETIEENLEHTHKRSYMKVPK